jgi:hypothetical protein
VKKTIATIILTLSAATASAQYSYPGNDMLSELNQGANWANGQANGFIWGVVDVLLVQELICIATGTTRKQLSDVVQQYIQVNPKYRHRDAVYLASAALIEAFPCKRPTKGQPS